MKFDYLIKFDHEWRKKKFPTIVKNTGSRNAKQDKKYKKR